MHTGQIGVPTADPTVARISRLGWPPCRMNGAPIFNLVRDGTRRYLGGRGSAGALQIEREPNWILKGLSAGVLGVVFWVVLGFALNVMGPLVGLAICCESLVPTYYLFAYWLPLAVGLVAGIIVLLAWARDRMSTKTRGELARASVKGAVLVLALWLSVMAYTGMLI